MINRLANWITRHPKLVVLVAVLLIIPSAIGFFSTAVNYDILSYLPDELDSVQGINILDESFGEASMSIIVMEDMSWDEMSKLEEDISAVEHVKSVLWLGAVSQSPIPVDMLPDAVTSMLYNAEGDSTLMMVQYEPIESSVESMKTIGLVKAQLTKHCLMSGMSAMTYDLSQLTEQEAPKYVAVAIALALLALAFTMESFILPFVLLAALGIAVIYNMGTNFMFGEISFITQSIAAILQLGVTMDYSVFLMDRYAEEKPKYKTREAAMAKAITGTFTSLAGSSLTTVFGFLALCFMSLTLGVDIGLVMAKGVLFGILTVVIVLPALILICEKLINKTMHRSLVPSFKGINKVTIKLRRVFAIVFVLLIPLCWYGQNNVSKYYNMMDAVPGSLDSIKALDVLKDEFNMASTYFVIIDDDLADGKKLELIDELQSVEGVSGAMGFNSIVGTAFESDIVPDSIKSMLIADGYQMMMVNSVYSPATDECNAQVEQLNKVIAKYDPNGKLTGEAPMYKDLIEITDRDFMVTSAISIIAIFLLIALIFKSISIPFILVMSIELAIWLNLTISFLSGEVICFITPTVISCVQLGATVDYAILLTTRFREELRSGKEKKEAMHTAASSAHKSIFQSALVFFAATIGVYMICDIDIVRSICGMLARGAVISALVIILFLTPILVVSEGFINKTTYRWREDKHPLQITSPMLERIQRNMKKNMKKTQKMQARVAKVVSTHEHDPHKLKKARPVPAELVTTHLGETDVAAIEKAMEQLPKERNEADTVTTAGADKPDTTDSTEDSKQ